MRYRSTVLVLAWLLGSAVPLLGTSCSLSSGSPTQNDAGADAAVSRDGVLPPDLGSRDGGRSGNVGSPCDPSTGQGCSGEAECLAISTGVGICAIPGCRPEDTTTPGTDDDCPALAGSTRRSICTTVEVQSGDGGYKTATYCLPECHASPIRNDCSEVNPALTCDPITVLLTGHTEVCLMPACTDSSQCGKDPINPGATCDPLSATCQNIGKAGVGVGSPCLVSTECGAGQTCLPETTDSKTGNVMLSGGYCTIIGCANYDPASKSQLWKCPDGSKCYMLGSSFSLCLAVGCDATKSPQEDGCRDEAPAGQYICTLQNGLGVCWLDVKGPK